MQHTFTHLQEAFPALSAAQELGLAMAYTRVAEAHTLSAAAAEAGYHIQAASSAASVRQELLLAPADLQHFQTADSSHCSSYS